MSLLPIALLALALTGPFGPQVQPRPRIAPPTKEGKPVEVRVGFLVLDFSKVDSREESFGLTGYLALTWNDPRLALPPGEVGGLPRRFSPAEVWTPSLFFPNALDQARWQDRDAEIEVADDGTVTWSGILTGKFSFEMQLQRFPFDRQTMPVRIGSYSDIRQVRLVPHVPSIGRARQAFLPDWGVGETTAFAVDYRYPPEDVPYSHVTIETGIVRRSTFYVWRVMVPISLLVMASWMAFWFEPVGLQPQISTCLALLLSLVTFHFGVDFALPKVTYLSLVEKHALNGLVFVLAAAVGVTVIHRLVVDQKISSALRVQRTARWLLPLAYAASVVAEFASSFAPLAGE
ncbi:MAG: hypothetical protein U0800_12385 [Isosphaeraceae bacterium]